VPAKSGSRTEIQDRWCQGLIASSARMRRTVDAEIGSAIPPLTTSTARSRQVHVDSGTPCLAGSSQASAMTSARCTSVNSLGRPGFPSVLGVACHDQVTGGLPQPWDPPRSMQSVHLIFLWG